MNEIKLTSQFKKDLKRYKHKAEVIDKLETILNLLAEGLPVPEENRSHLLTGNYTIIKDIWSVMWKVTLC